MISAWSTERGIQSTAGGHQEKCQYFFHTGLLKGKKGQRHSVLLKPSWFTIQVTFYFLKMVKRQISFSKDMVSLQRCVFLSRRYFVFLKPTQFTFKDHTKTDFIFIFSFFKKHTVLWTYKEDALHQKVSKRRYSILEYLRNYITRRWKAPSLC